MRKFFIIILIFYVTASYSQNLVPNSSFEVITQCPEFDGAIIYATPWFSAIHDVMGASTPDLFNPCSPTWVQRVPYNGWGVQYARTGVGYAGVFLYGIQILTDTMEREYIEVRLNETLKTNETYLIHFYISLADYNCYAINRIGLLVSKDSVSGRIQRPLPYTPQIFGDTNLTFNDSSKWVAISGRYKALGGEKFITIGNFYIDSKINIQYLDYCQSFKAAYYYIDDVAVYKMTDPIYSAEAGENSIICRKDSVVLGSPAHPNYRYRWKPARGLNCDTIAQPTAKPFATTTYHLTQYDYTDLETYDSVTVTVKNCDSTEQGNGLIIYPNPSQGEFFIEFSSYVPEDARFTVSNTLGQVLIKSDITREERKKLVNTGFLASGVYFVRVYEGENLMKSEKIVKVKNEK